MALEETRPGYYGGPDNPHEVGKCLEAWEANQHTYLWTALVYLARCGKKPDQDAVKDLKKAQFYIQQEINQREGRGWGDNGEDEGKQVWTSETCKHAELEFVGYETDPGGVAQSGSIIELPLKKGVNVFIRTGGRPGRQSEEVYVCRMCGRAIIRGG